MKITICGSIAFIDDMSRAKEALLAAGHEVEMPPLEVPGDDGAMMPVIDYYAVRKNGTAQETWIWERKAEAMKSHFDKVDWSDAILVLNHDKNGIAGYIGSNTFLEIGLAFHTGKKIFLLHPIPEIQAKEELLAISPTVINGDLALITESA